MDGNGEVKLVKLCENSKKKKFFFFGGGGGGLGVELGGSGLM